jgi:hypothetical protein
MRTATCAVAIAAAGLLTACGAVGQRPAAPSTSGSPSAPAVAASPRVSLHTPPTNASGTVTVREQDNGGAVQLHAGERLQLVLSSTYWHVAGSTDQNVLRAAAEPVVSPRMTGCVPGEGCGTVTALFDALGPGRADVSAQRTSCGEAMACTGSQGTYRVTVLVTG